MPVDLQEIVLGEQAGGLRRQGDASTNYLAALDRVMLNEYTSPSITEAAAAKEIASSSIAREMASFNLARQTPQPGTP